MFHLRKIHGYDGEHPIEDYRRTFRLKFASCAESRRKIGAAKDAYWARTGQHWTDRKLLAEVRHRAIGPAKAFEAGMFPTGSTWPVDACLEPRGAAVEKAGLNYEEVTGIFRWTWAKSSKPFAIWPLRIFHCQRLRSRASWCGFSTRRSRHFREAGQRLSGQPDLSPTNTRSAQRLDAGRCAEAWVRKQSARGRSLLAQPLLANSRGLSTGGLHTTWPEFVESLGVPYPGIKKRYAYWTKETLLEEIRRWKAEGHKLNLTCPFSQATRR